MENIKIFACNSAEKFTQEICDCLCLSIGQKEAFKFKNDNTFVQFKETVRDQDIYIVQTTQIPVNAKKASAERITVVLPYFIYSRSIESTSNCKVNG